MTRRRLRLPHLFALLGLVLTVGSVASDVLAIVGRPATPLSYAGVARRTVRRATY
jgi:hypothetical protein